MTSRLSSDALNQLSPLLASLARLVAGGNPVNEAQLHTLLVGVGLEEEPAALAELQRWNRLLNTLHAQPSAANRQATVEALRLRGLDEATALLAVATVADRASVSPHAGMAPGKAVAPALRVSVERLDLGTLRPGQVAECDFEVQGGPGQIEVECDQVRVEPRQFGAAPTRIRVAVKPVHGGLVWTSLKLITSRETVELPVLAQWPDPAQPATDWSALAMQATAPVLALRGSFRLPALVQQGMVRRLGRGHLIQVIPLGEERVLVIAHGGAGLFDLSTGDCLWEVDCPTTCGALSPDGTTLVLGGSDGLLYLWDLSRGKLRLTLQGHEYTVESVAFSPDGALLASGAHLDKTVRLWRVADGTRVRTLQGHVDSVLSVAFSPDGALLASGSNDHTVRLWRVQ